MRFLFIVVLVILLTGALAGCAGGSMRAPAKAPAARGSESADTLRVMTLNVAHGARSPFPPVFQPRRAIEDNLTDIAALLRAERPDVVALEELDRKSFWSRDIDHLEWIGDASGYEHRAFGAGRDIRRGPFAMRQGTGLLAALPIDGEQSMAFHAWPLDDKSFVVATIRPPALGGRAVDVVSIHLDPFFEGTRKAHVRMTVTALALRPHRPLVVMGDMNASWKDGRAALGMLARQLGLRAYLARDAGDTYPAGRPWRRIDWILVSDELEFAGYRTLPAAVSDHRAVVAELRLAADARP